jgi:hypothetical protein
MKELTLLRNARKRLYSKSIQNDECLDYTGAINNSGYGKFWYLGRTDYAHRVSFIIDRDSIPEDKQIDHKCRNKICINPRHLSLVTPKQNIERSMKYRNVKSITESSLCPKGHIKAHNTTKSGHCKTCKNEYNKRLRTLKKGQI